MVTSSWRTWLSTSVFSPTVDAYQALLERGGYSASHTSAYLHAVGHFAHWFTEEHLTLRALNEVVVHRFITEHLPTCRCTSRCQRTVVVVRAALGHLLDVLRTDDRIPARRVGLSLAIHDELARFDRHLDHVCGLAVKTRVGRRWWVAHFLADQFESGPIAVHRLTPRDVVAYLRQHGRGYTPASAGVRASALRSYFRFRAAHYGDRVDALIAAMPTVACWRLTALPSALTQEETSRFVQAFDRRTTRGRRGYAMARCMLDLGLRVSEVVALQLDDLNWRDGTVRISAGKSRRVVDYAADPFTHDELQGRMPARLVLVDSIQRAWQEAKYLGNHHVLLPADPWLAGLNELQSRLWRRLRAAPSANGVAA